MWGKKGKLVFTFDQDQEEHPLNIISQNAGTIKPGFTVHKCQCPDWTSAVQLTHAQIKQG